MKHSLHLYNTETKQKEKIAPIDGKTIRMYTCGPTVYNYAHIGNFRTYIFEDLLRRTLLFLGYSVKQVMNLTDVDDKTIRGAIQNHQTLDEYVEPFIRAFFDDLKELNIQKAEHYPKATEYIQDMIQMIQDLLDRKIAYVGHDQSIYFSIQEFSSYGRLSHLDLDQLKAGASKRISEDEYNKEAIADFVLWKAYDVKRDGKIFWKSPFGPGRPGWHIECSAMAMKILGKTIDIHCGGVDNIFPHHENEIAQSECYNNQRFVEHWVHSAHLLVENKKMSKSANNFFTFRDLIQKGYSARQIRYVLLKTHYRMQLNFTFQDLEGTKNTLERIDACIDRLKQPQNGTVSEKFAREWELFQENFAKALSDDLNISLALSHLFDWIRELNSFMDQNQLSQKCCQQALESFQSIDRVLGIIFVEKTIEIPKDILEAAQKREKARVAKNYQEADSLRDYILKKGFVVEDSPSGPKIKSK